MAINFIRLEKHLFGQTPWDAYEKARELYRLNSDEDYSLKRLEQLTKLTASDIKNNIQAFMDMEEQFGELDEVERGLQPAQNTCMYIS